MSEGLRHVPRLAGGRCGRNRRHRGDVASTAAATADATADAGVTAERGSVTAEVAIALPALALVLALCLGGVHAVGQHVRLQDAASAAARALGRGEPDSVALDLVVASVPGATVAVDRQDELVCATASVSLVVAGARTPLVLGARSCAATAGR